MTIASTSSRFLWVAAAACLQGCANDLSLRTQAKRIDELSARTTRVEESFDKVRERLDGQRDELATLASRERKNDREIAALKAASPRFEQRLAETEAKRLRLEERVRLAETGNAELKESHRHVNVLLAEVERELENLRTGATTGADETPTDENAASSKQRLEQLQSELLRVRAAVRALRQPVAGSSQTKLAGTEVETLTATVVRPEPAAVAHPISTPASQPPTQSGGAWSNALEYLTTHSVEVGFLVICALAIVSPLVWLLHGRRRAARAAAAAQAAPSEPVTKEADAVDEPQPVPRSKRRRARRRESEARAEPVEKEAAVEIADAAPAVEDVDAEEEPGQREQQTAAPEPQVRAAPAPPRPVTATGATSGQARSTSPGERSNTTPLLPPVEAVVEALGRALPDAEAVSRAYAKRAAKEATRVESRRAEQPEQTQVIEASLTPPAGADSAALPTEDMGVAEDARETMLVSSTLRAPPTSKPATPPRREPRPAAEDAEERPTLILDTPEGVGMTQVIGVASGKLREPPAPPARPPTSAAPPPRARTDKELLAELEQLIGYNLDKKR